MRFSQCFVGLPLFAMAILCSSPVQAGPYTLDFSALSYPDSGCEWSGRDNLNDNEGHGGFSWSNLYSLDLSNYFGECYQRLRDAGTGYPVGDAGDPADVQGTVGLGFGDAAFSRDDPFVLTGGIFGAGWNPSVALTVSGFLGEKRRFQSTFTVGIDGGRQQSFGRELIDRVAFSANFNPENLDVVRNDPLFSRQEFTPQEGDPLYYQTYFIEQLQFISSTSVPAPVPLVLLLVGLAALVGSRKFSRLRTP